MMPISDTRRWILFTSVAFALPVLAASWWMLTPEPAPVPGPVLGNDDAILPVALGTGPAAGRTGGTSIGTGTEAGDPATFRASAEALRAQGCPEQTVRELIASRITASFESRRAALRSTSGDADAIRAKLNALAREQGALIAQVVGPEEAPAEAAAAPIAEIAKGTEAQVLMPAVMADTPPPTVKTEEQAADWAKLRHDFVDAIGGTHADPASPQYRQRWVRAESEADQRFRLLFGDTAYVQHQMQAQQQARMREQGLAK